MNKQKQKELLIEIMEADSKDGLYNKQTAVEWLYEVLINHLSHEQQMQFEGLFQQAKQMEEDQSLEDYRAGFSKGWQDSNRQFREDIARMYNKFNVNNSND